MCNVLKRTALLGPTRSRHFQHRVDKLKDGAVLEAPRAVAAGARGVPPLTPPDVAAASREEEEQVGRQRRPGKRREGVRVDDGVVQRVPAQVSELLTAWVAGRGKTVVWAAPPGGSGAARPLLSSRAQRAPRAVGGQLQLRRCQDDELDHCGRAA